MTSRRNRVGQWLPIVAGGVAILAIALVIGTEVAGLASQRSSVEDQRNRMLIVFFAYLVLLFAIRAVLNRMPARSVAANPTAQKFKIAIAAIGVGGAGFIVMAVIGFVLGGAEMLTAMMTRMLLIVPAIALAVSPLIKRSLK